MGLQDPLGQGPGLRGLPGPALLLAVRDAAVATPRRAWTTSTGTARTRRSPWSLVRSWPRTPRRAPALLAWTTTPWTLPSNLALAVGPDIDYAVIEQRRRAATILAEAAPRRLRARARRDAARAVGTVKGSQLVGRRTSRCSPSSPTSPTPSRCSPPTSSPPRTAPASCTWRPASARTTRRRAPTAGIAVVLPRRRPGAQFTDVVPDYAGMHVFDANPRRHRRPQGRRRGGAPRHLRPQLPALLAQPTAARLPGGVVVVRAGDGVPRPDGRAQPEIDWVPEHLKDGSFGKWLENARDWTISRNRFWGSPDPGVEERRPGRTRGSTSTAVLDELERDFGVRPTDLHRPSIDELARPNPDDPTGQSTMRRVPEVLDCWFDSGSMPFAQVHYPFENTDWFEHHYPGDFIVEYVGPDARLVLHAARPGHGAVRPAGVRHRAWPTASCSATTGRRCRSACATTPTPYEVFDTLRRRRHALVPAVVAVLRGGDLVVTEQGIRDAASQVLRPLWNAWSFFTLYANADGYRAAVAHRLRRNVLDRYLLAKLHDLVADRHRPAWTPTTSSGACARGAQLPRRAHQLVHPPQPRPLLGRRPRRLRHPAHGPRGADAASPRRCCRWWPRRSTSASPAGAASTSPTGRRPPSCPPTPTWCRPWIASATCARRRCRSARRGACGCACRWRRSPWPRPTPQALAPFTDHRRRRGQRERGGARPTTWTSLCRPRAAGGPGGVLGPRLGAETQRVIRAVQAGRLVGGRRSRRRRRRRAARGRVLAAPRAGRRRAGRHPARQRRRGAARHRHHSGAGRRRHGPRPRPRGAAGPAHGRARGVGPHRLNVDASPAVQAALAPHRRLRDGRDPGHRDQLGPVAEAPATEVGDGESVRLAVSRA